MGRLRALLDLSDAVLEVSWALLGLSWAVLGASEALLGLTWAVLGRKWPQLGPLDLGLRPLPPQTPPCYFSRLTDRDASALSVIRRPLLTCLAEGRKARVLAVRARGRWLSVLEPCWCEGFGTTCKDLAKSPAKKYE